MPCTPGPSLRSKNEIEHVQKSVRAQHDKRWLSVHEPQTCYSRVERDSREPFATFDIPDRNSATGAAKREEHVAIGTCSERYRLGPSPGDFLSGELPGRACVPNAHYIAAGSRYKRTPVARLQKRNATDARHTRLRSQTGAFRHRGNVREWAGQHLASVEIPHPHNAGVTARD